MSTKVIPLLVLICWLGNALGATPQPIPATTVSGIALDHAWKATIYDFARSRLAHPAWGWTHSERVYHLAVSIAEGENQTVDEDVLFAAAFLHDVGAIAPFAAEGVDHADRSAELAEALLRDAGFPMEKFPRVRAAILTHMFDKSPGDDVVAIILHDADTLDFLGAMGFARRLSVTGTATSFANGVQRLVSAIAAAPAGLVSETARGKAESRIREMQDLLKSLEAQAIGVPY